jgi:two-component system phosphate regulon response regulator PhoB
MGKDTKGNKKILLVEDDLSLAQVYKSRLELEGFEVQHSKDGEEALKTTIDFMPDLVLLDVMMPKINGFDVLDILRNTPQTKDIHVIMLTALGQSKDQDRATALGADEYLVKSQVVIGDVVAHIKAKLGVD